MFGRFLDEKLGKIHFWGTVLGLLLFASLFVLTDMPRRVYIYDEVTWGSYNLVATIGAVIAFLAQLVFLYNLVRSLSHGEQAGSNPWGASTLEWSDSD